jgi:uncharacterized protein with HEPN domain
MAAFRDALIHGYEGVDINKVWTTATKALPAVRTAIAAIVPSVEQLALELRRPASGPPQE